MNEMFWKQQLRKYARNKMLMLIIALGIGLLGYSTYFITEGWFVFLPMSLLLGIMLYQKRVGDMKTALIKAVNEDICRNFEASCSDRLFDEKTCKASLLFPPYINSFYLNIDIPRQVYQIVDQGCSMQFSVLSIGEVFAKTEKVGKHYVVHSGAQGVTSRISSEGIFFCCLMPFSFPGNRLFLPRKWGHHLENISLKNFIGTSFHKKTQPPFSLIKEANSSVWIYGSTMDIMEEDFWMKCYTKLQEFPFSMLSIVERTIYIYIPFSWKISPKYLMQSTSEYISIIELIRDLVFNDIKNNVKENLK